MSACRDTGVKVGILTRSGTILVPGSGGWWTNGLDGSDGSDFTGRSKRRRWAQIGADSADGADAKRRWRR